MTVTRRVVIRMEKERTMRVQPIAIHCQVCNNTPEMLPAQDAALLAGISLRELCRRVEAGQLHHHETPDGRLFLCVSAVTAATQR